MNEDRIVGAGRNALGKAERSVGRVVGSKRLKGDGVVDQVAGAVQHGYGQLRDRVDDVIDDTPGAIVDVLDRGRDLGRRGDRLIRDQLDDNGHLYLIGGAVALFALGAFALKRSGSNTSLTMYPPQRRGSKAKRST